MEEMDELTYSEGKDRRQFPRLSTTVDIEYKVLSKQAARETKTVTKNIGAGGICLIVYEKVELGDILLLRMHLKDIGYTVRAEGKVVWSSYFAVGRDGQDRYDVGIEFVQIEEADRQKLSRYIFRYGGE